MTNSCWSLPLATAAHSLASKARPPSMPNPLGTGCCGASAGCCGRDSDVVPSAVGDGVLGRSAQYRLQHAIAYPYAGPFNMGNDVRPATSR